MTDPWLVIAGIVALALGYVLVPVMSDTFARFRRARHISCPEMDMGAEIRLDAPRAALTAAVRHRPQVRIRSCSLWAWRTACRQACLRCVDLESARS